MYLDIHTNKYINIYYLSGCFNYLIMLNVVLKTLYQYLQMYMHLVKNL